MSLNQWNYQLPGNNIAYAFSDAAGANACIAMYEMNKTSGEQWLYSNRKHFPLRYAELVQQKMPDFSKHSIDCLFTGTSHPASSEGFEAKCIKEARTAGVYTISFIDHWVNFKLRFEGLDNEELPDEIWVVDENAKELAAEEGLQEEKLKVKGNPYHHYLANNWKPAYSDKRYLEKLGITKHAFHILFAPDPFSIRNIFERTGFTETEALKTLLEITKDIEDAFLIVKMHPLQPEESLTAVFEKEQTTAYKLLKEADVTELINSCDLVVGFYSNLLLEAKALGKNVVRYFPGNREADVLAKSQQFSNASQTNAELRNQILSFIHE